MTNTKTDAEAKSLEARLKEAKQMMPDAKSVFAENHIGGYLDEFLYLRGIVDVAYADGKDYKVVASVGDVFCRSIGSTDYFKTEFCWRDMEIAFQQKGNQPQEAGEPRTYNIAETVKGAGREAYRFDEGATHESNEGVQARNFALDPFTHMDMSLAGSMLRINLKDDAGKTGAEYRVNLDKCVDYMTREKG